MDDAAPGVGRRYDRRGSSNCRIPQPRWLVFAACVTGGSEPEYLPPPSSPVPALCSCTLHRVSSRRPTRSRSHIAAEVRSRNPRGLSSAAGSAAALSRPRLPRWICPLGVPLAAALTTHVTRAAGGPPLQSLSCIARGQKTFVRISPCAD